MPRLVPERFLAALRPSAASGPLDVTVEVARESRRRVRVAALLGAAGYAVFLLLALTRLTEATPLERTIDVTHDLVGVALSLSLLLVAMLPAIRDRHVMTAALIAQVFLCAMISISVSWAGFIRTGHVASLTGSSRSSSWFRC